ncbi:MAG: hypothetical protein AAFX93_04335 [Verrucomicrobiota bacterium]
MGRTSAMFIDPAWHALRNATFHDWPNWAGETTLPDMAKRLIDEHSIKAGDYSVFCEHE